MLEGLGRGLAATASVLLANKIGTIATEARRRSRIVVIEFLVSVTLLEWLKIEDSSQSILKLKTTKQRNKFTTDKQEIIGG